MPLRPHASPSALLVLARMARVRSGEWGGCHHLRTAGSTCRSFGRGCFSALRPRTCLQALARHRPPH
eukprot:13549313-Alexandrium_andersonii.AAC.1